MAESVLDAEQPAPDIETHEIALRREVLTAALYFEADPLIRGHAKEVCDFRGHELDPDLEKYLQMEGAGILRVYTARRGPKLIGYSIYILANHLHYKAVSQANHYLAFIDPLERGFGRSFLEWCEDELKQEGIKMMVYQAKPGSKFYQIISSMKVREMEHIFCKEI